MRIEDVQDGVGPVPLGLLQLPPDLLPPGGGQDGDLLPGHGLAPLLHCHRGQRCHVGQGLLPLNGGVTQHLGHSVVIFIPENHEDHFLKSVKLEKMINISL